MKARSRQCTKQQLAPHSVHRQAKVEDECLRLHSTISILSSRFHRNSLTLRKNWRWYKIQSTGSLVNMPVPKAQKTVYGVAHHVSKSAVLFSRFLFYCFFQLRIYLPVIKIKDDSNAVLIALFDIPTQRMFSLITNRITVIHTIRLRLRTIKMHSTWKKKPKLSTLTRWICRQLIKILTGAKKVQLHNLSMK